MKGFFLALLLGVSSVSADAMSVQMDFTVGNFNAGVNAPTDPVIGSIVWVADSISSPIQSLTSINLTTDGHAFDLGEIGFTDPALMDGDFLLIIGGTVNGVETIGWSSSGTQDDFVIGWLMNSSAPQGFGYASHSRNRVFSTLLDSGNAEFISFSIAPVPVPAAVWLFCSALGLLGWVRRKKA